MSRQLLLDTETTGFEPKEGHRIIEFAALEMIDRKLTGNYLHLYCNPEREIPLEATNVHGISNDDVKDKPVFKDIANDIIEYIQSAELIIHNAKFDLNFLDHHFKELGYNQTLTYTTGVIDTLMIARSKFPGAKNSLDGLCDRFKIDRTNRSYHGALIDCELLADVYINLTKEQISLLGEERNLQSTNIKHEFTKIDASQYNLSHVIVSPEENSTHLEYLRQLDKISKGKCLWYNQSQEFINE